MDETDLTGLVPVSDPALIAQLEQPQSAINKGETGGTTAAYSQSALDAFDRAISSAERLKKHRGYGAAVGSGFDPQAWGSYVPFNNDPDDNGLRAVSGTSARDFEAELGAMKAQVFLPMVQSMKGMGALSNAEGAKLTTAIGALDPGMSEDAFRSSLDRIIGDLTEYRNRGAPQTKEGQQRGGAPAVAPPPGPSGPVEFGSAPTPPGWRMTPEQEQQIGAFMASNRNLTGQQLQGALGAIAGGASIPDDEAEKIAAYIRGGGDPTKIGISYERADDAALTDAQKAEVAAKVAETGQGGSLAAGVGDSLSVGFLDEAGAGADALTGALSGEGAFTDLYGDNLAVNRAYQDALQERDPWTYGAGQVAGGIVLPMGAAKTPAELAKISAAYGAAYGAGSSDSLADVPGNVAIGAGVGLATGWGGGKLLDKLAGRKAAKTAAEVASDGGGTAAENYGRAQGFGIDITPADAGGSGAKVLERGLDILPGSASVMNKNRAKIGEQVEGAVEDVAGKYGRTTSFTGIGEAGQRGARAWMSKFDEVSTKAYDAIPVSPKAQAALPNATQALSELTTIFESNPKMAEVFKNTRLSRYMDALSGKIVPVDEIGPRAGLNRAIGATPTMEVGGKLSWADLKSFRSRIGEEIGDQRFSESPTKTELRRLYAALSEDMKATASAQGPGALRAFERANNLYREGQQRIDGALSKLLGDDGKKSVESAAAKIQALAKDGKSSADLKTLHEVWKSLPAGERGEVANGVIRLLGQPVNSEGRAFSAQTFVKNFVDMAPEAKNLMFGPIDKELRTNLDEFAKVVGGVAANNSTRNTSNTGQAFAGAAVFSVGSLPGLLGQAATSYGAAKLWTNPKFVRWATGYTKMVKGAEKAAKAPTADGIKTQAKLLEKVAATDPAIAQDIFGLRDALMRGANDNVAGRASAGDDQQDRQ
ncbi:MAG: hypothetical protein V4696_00750 [Pseudomonadota bacterium]